MDTKDMDYEFAVNDAFKGVIGMYPYYKLIECLVNSLNVRQQKDIMHWLLIDDSNTDRVPKNPVPGSKPVDDKDIHTLPLHHDSQVVNAPYGPIVDPLGLTRPDKLRIPTIIAKIKANQPIFKDGDIHCPVCDEACYIDDTTHRVYCNRKNCPYVYEYSHDKHKESPVVKPHWCKQCSNTFATYIDLKEHNDTEH